MQRTMVTVVLGAAAALIVAGAVAQTQDAADFEPPPFHEYDPPSTLVVEEHPVKVARFPFVDVHAHQAGMGDETDLGELVAAMDEMNMGIMVNLSGRGFRRIERPDGTFAFGLQPPEYLARAIERAREAAPGRFAVFTNVDFSEIGSEGWTERAVAELEADVAVGAQGLKIYKSLGMFTRDVDGKRVAVDDPRLDPIWAAAGRLGIPVLIHTADPHQFWQLKDDQNERLFELMERPRRYYGPDAETTFEQLLDEQLAIVRRHPATVFIAAHLAWLGSDLGRLGALLDELPNLHTEIGAVLAELGRQPRAAKKFLIEHQDRVLFGKDSWNPQEYHVYFRVLETEDEYFDYYRRRHAFWKMYGIALPDDVLQKLYYGNALRIVPGLDASLFPAL